MACFQDQRNVLSRLALLITGDQATADQAVVQTCELHFEEQSLPRLAFRVAKTTTIASAISHSTEAFAAVNPCTKIYDAHMSSTYGKVILKNARLVSTSFFEPMPKR